jgi:formylmethanofuran dehydrogenase subunit C
MLNGLLEIRGDAGEGAGAALAGHMAGMRGGLIVVHGSAGTRAGDRMRRGLIAIGGDCGALAGSRMIAGTILVGGKLGDRPGMLMKRGTIMGASARNMLPTFNDCGRFELNFTSLYAMAFAAHGVKIPVAIARNVRRFAGDMASLGKGEILLVR